MARVQRVGEPPLPGDGPPQRRRRVGLREPDDAVVARPREVLRRLLERAAQPLQHAQCEAERDKRRAVERRGRAHRGGEIDRAYGYAREVGFQQINIDLIAGMLDETEDNWKACVAKAIEMAPDSITVYQMEVPYNTTIYKRMKEEGKLAAPVADWDTKRRWTDYAYNELAKNCLLYTSPSPRDKRQSRMPSSA